MNSHVSSHQSSSDQGAPGLVPHGLLGNGQPMRFVRSQHLEVERQESEGAIIVHGLLGNRLEINQATRRFLDLFEKPKALEELAAPEAIERARPAFERLRRAGFLVRAGHQETLSDKLLQRISPGFFASPALRAGDTKPPQVAFLGVPFDYGNHRDPGARFAPQALRELCAATLHYTLQAEDGRPKGWFDNRLQRPLLNGVTLGDAGNLFVAPNEAPEQVFDKLRAAVQDLLAAGSFPVVVGGDHSLTYAAVSAYREDLAVLQVDAHSDLAPYYPSVANHHGNVMSRLLGLEHVQGLYQVGVRGSTALPLSQGRSGLRLSVTPQRLRQLGVAGLLEQLPEELPYYLSFDIDALDPSAAPGTSTPVPGGLSFDEALDLLTAVGEQRRTVGLDLVEINPRRDPCELTLYAGMELMLAFLGARFHNASPEIDARPDIGQEQSHV